MNENARSHSTPTSTSMSVSVLSVTPVKGLALHHPRHVDVAAGGGVVGDRAFFLVDSEGALISCTEIGALMQHRAEYDAESRVLALHGPDGLVRSGVVELGEPVSTDFYGLRTVEGHLVPDWQDVFTQIAGRSVRLVAGGSGAFDVAGVTLLGAASIEEVAASNHAEPVDGRRFRMNVQISGGSAYDEDTWRDRDLQLGDAVLRVGGPIKRCAATTRHPDTGEVDLQTLKMIGTSRGRWETLEWGKGFYLGVYADVVVPGRITVGDEVRLVG